MKKNKKIKNKKEISISDLNLEEFAPLILDSLIYEDNINFKKKNNIPLSSNEQFFDTYFIPPSTLLNIIKRRIK